MSDSRSTIDFGERGRVNVVADANALARAAAELFVSVANAAVARSGLATIALSGGSTPKQMGRVLAEDPFRSRVPWGNLQIFWGDERWVPLESAESNAGEAIRTFLDHVAIPAERVNPYQTHSVTPAESADRYESLVRSLVGGDAHPVFDLILLGMGDDGHTASLFPGTDALHETERLVVSNFVPKLDTTRLTFTPPLINAAREVAFLAAGGGKADRLVDVLEGPIDVVQLPSQVVRPAGGPLWLVDQSAAAKLAKRPE